MYDHVLGLNSLPSTKEKVWCLVWKDQKNMHLSSPEASNHGNKMLVNTIVFLENVKSHRQNFSLCLVPWNILGAVWFLRQDKAEESDIQKIAR